MDGVEVSLQKFPSASLRFNNIYTRGINSAEGDTLIHASGVFFQFDIWDVLTSDLVIDKISFEDTELNIKLLKNGNNNFKIWKNSESNDNQVFTLKEISLTRVNFNLFDYQDDLFISLNTPNTTLNGNFTDGNLSIKSDGLFYINHIANSDSSLLTNIDTRLQLKLVSDGNQGLSFQGDLNLIDSDFQIAGESDKNGFRLQAENVDLELQELFSFLSEQKLYKDSNWNLKGKASAKLELEARKDADLSYKIDFSSDNSSLANQTDFELKQFKYAGYYENKSGKDKVVLNSFSGKSGKKKIEGDLNIHNLKRPFLELNVQSSLNLEELIKLSPVDTIEKIEGNMELNLKFKNQFRSFSDIKAQDLRKVVSSGNINISEGEILFRGWDKKVKSINGELSFNNSKIKVDRLFFQLNNSDLFLDGSFENVLNYILFEEQKLTVNCRLKSQQTELEDFIENSSGSGDYNFSFTESIILDLELDLQNFSMKRFRGTDIKGNLKIKDGLILVDRLVLNSDDGSYNGSLRINTKNTERYKVDARLSFDGINVNRLFKSFENFGQDAIVAKNIFGRVTGKGEFSAFMNPNLEIDKSSIKLESDIEIKNGHIKDYEPMLALSKYSDIEDLKDVHFNSLKNHISIANSIINIPAMQIKSNVLDLQLSGQHGFDNMVSYRLKLKASDALFKNRKKKNSKPSEFDEHLKLNERKDAHYIFIKMSGPIDDLKIELDNASLGQSIGEGINKQGKELKDIFKKEKKDKKTDDPGIIYEWDDDDDG